MNPLTNGICKGNAAISEIPALAQQYQWILTMSEPIQLYPLGRLGSDIHYVYYGDPLLAEDEGNWVALTYEQSIRYEVILLLNIEGKAELNDAVYWPSHLPQQQSS